PSLQRIPRGIAVAWSYALYRRQSHPNEISKRVGRSDNEDIFAKDNYYFSIYLPTVLIGGCAKKTKVKAADGTVTAARAAVRKQELFGCYPDGSVFSGRGGRQFAHIDLRDFGKAARFFR